MFCETNSSDAISRNDEPAREQSQHVALAARSAPRRAARAGTSDVATRAPGAGGAGPSRRSGTRHAASSTRSSTGRAVGGDRLEHAVLGGELDGDLHGLGGRRAVDVGDRARQQRGPRTTWCRAQRGSARRTASTASGCRPAARWTLASQIGPQNGSSI